MWLATLVVPVNMKPNPFLARMARTVRCVPHRQISVDPWCTSCLGMPVHIYSMFETSMVRVSTGDPRGWQRPCASHSLATSWLWWPHQRSRWSMYSSSDRVTYGRKVASWGDPQYRRWRDGGGGWRCLGPTAVGGYRQQSQGHSGHWRWGAVTRTKVPKERFKKRTYPLSLPWPGG
jgi:hypothetical protein